MMWKLFRVSLLKYCTHEMRAFSKALIQGSGRSCTDWGPAHSDAHSGFGRQHEWLESFYLSLLLVLFGILDSRCRSVSFYPAPLNSSCTFVNCICVNVPPLFKLGGYCVEGFLIDASLGHYCVKLFFITHRTEKKTRYCFWKRCSQKKLNIVAHWITLKLVSDKI